MTALSVCILLWFAIPGISPAYADTFPSRRITLVVPFAAGSPSDVTSRLLAEHMGRTLHTYITVENTPDAGGTVAAVRASCSRPDGYTLLIHDTRLAADPALLRDLPYDPVRDLEPIGMVGEPVLTLVAQRGFPSDSLQQLIERVREGTTPVALALAEPGTDSYLCGRQVMYALNTAPATTAVTEPPLTAATGTAVLATAPAITAASYGSTNLALKDLTAGRVSLLCSHFLPALLPIKLQQINVYGVTTSTRFQMLPEIPTVREAGLPGPGVSMWQGMFAPKKTPPAVIEAVVRAFRAALEDAGVRARFINQGTIPATKEQASPETLRSLLRSDSERWQQIVTSTDRGY